MAKRREDDPTSIRALLTAASVRFCFALLVGVAVSLPLLLPDAPLEFRQSYRFSGFPEDDGLLVGWLESQPNVSNWKVIRNGEGSGLDLRYIRRGIGAETLHPPMQKLGYEGLAGGTLSRGLAFALLFKEPFFSLVLLISTQGGFLMVGLWWLRDAKRRGTPLPDLFEGRMRDATVYGLVLGGCLVAIGFAYDTLLGILPFEFSDTAGVWRAITELSSASLIPVLLFGSVFAPICEELFFRGAVFGSFKAAKRPVLGAVFSALLFAFAHLDLVNLAPFLVFGLLTAWAYHQTHSLVTVVIAHALNNTVAFVLILW